MRHGTGGRLVAVASAVAFALGGLACTKDTAPPAAGPATGPASASPTAGAPVDVPIPDRAFVVAPHNPSGLGPDESGILPDFCGARYPSDADIGRRRARTIYFFSPEATAEYVPDGTVNQTITVYRAEGARTAMAELRAAVRACPTRTELGTTYRYEVVAAPPVADESLLVRLTGSNPELPIGYDAYASAVRLGDLVAVLLVVGWEGATVRRSEVDSFTDQAVERIRAWRP